MNNLKIFPAKKNTPEELIETQLKKLKILPAKKNKPKEIFKIHNYLLQPPFNSLIISPTCSGKSTVILNLILNDNFYKKIFDKIYYFSPSVMIDETLNAIAEDEDIIKFDDDDDLNNADNILKAIEHEQKDKPEEERKNILIVYDDMLPYLKTTSYIGKLYTKSRHYKISCLLTSQHYSSAPLKCRNNSQMILISKLYNESELEKVNHELGANFKNFLHYYNLCVNEPYGFIYCDFRNMKLYKNFDTLLWSKMDDLSKNKLNNKSSSESSYESSSESSSESSAGDDEYYKDYKDIKNKINKFRKIIKKK